MNSIPVKTQTYLGLFCITLATLMLEILLTRLFSVTMWYHFAFVAISVAMLGMTVGALSVYLFPTYFTEEKVKEQMAISAFLFSISIVFSFFTQLSFPFLQNYSLVGIYAIGFRFFVITLPFVFSGICVCLALTKFPKKISQLYAADLAGAALGCIAIIFLLEFTDGLTAFIAVATIAGMGACFFAFDTPFMRLQKTTLLLFVLLLTSTIIHTLLVHQKFPLLQLIWIKERQERTNILYEKWNSFSRITVQGNKHRLKKPFGWGMSTQYPKEGKVNEVNLFIDENASTVITGFDGDIKNLWHFKYDVTNIAHFLRPNADLLIVGAGGGRDILSGLAFEQKSIRAVEINEDIIHALTQEFGEFSGHLDRNPKVTIVQDEARSYITRLQEKFDLIQISLIDTFAATAAGAYVLSENGLYTEEAWLNFLQHLNPRGILTVSRWSVGKTPYELYRTVSLATTALKKYGVSDPRQHILIVRCLFPEEISGVGSILVSPDPFTKEDLQILRKVSKEMNFEIVLSSEEVLDSSFASLTSLKEYDSFVASFPFDISCPTDNRPFFFNMLRLKDIFKSDLLRNESIDSNLTAVFTLAVLILVMFVFTFLGIFLPLFFSSKSVSKATLKTAIPFFLFFMGIGLGFMFIEISQMQRLIVFLGHPIYGLSVVLFALLLSCGLGSFVTQKIENQHLASFGKCCLFLLVGFLLFFGGATSKIITHSQALETPIRILIAMGILVFPGFFMGMAFPLGMKMAEQQTPELTPWFWGVNGATSVFASVLCVGVAMAFGISFAFWIGVFCYLVSFLCYVRIQQKQIVS